MQTLLLHELCSCALTNDLLKINIAGCGIPDQRVCLFKILISSFVLASGKAASTQIPHSRFMVVASPVHLCQHWGLTVVLIFAHAIRGIFSSPHLLFLISQTGPLSRLLSYLKTVTHFRYQLELLISATKAKL